MLKAVLFDLDHTLIDWDAAEPWENYQAQRLGTLREFVHNEIHPLPDEIDARAFFTHYVTELNRTWDESNRTLRAPDIRAILADVLRACDVPVEGIDPERLVRAYDWGPAPGERPYADVMEVLPELHAHGIELGIVTNASHPMIYRDRELDAMAILDYFPRCRVAAVDFGTIKPDPSIFDHALNLMGVCAEEAVFVGDNLIADVKGAQSAGIYGVWRKGPDADAQMAVHEGVIVPDGVISTLHDLLPLLDGWYPGWRNGASSS